MNTQNTLRALGALSFFAICMSCTVDVTPDEAVQANARGATAQQIEDGTCAGSCGEQSDDGCWCDDQCESFGDCCSDYLPECAMPIQCPEILCAPDTVPVNNDDDPCMDACEPVESECFDDSMCDEGERCEAITGGQCCPPNALCSFDIPPCAGECVEVEVESCFDDSMCADGQRCVADNLGQCCPPNALCSFDIPPCDGHCEDIPANECNNDADCENGYCELFATCAGLNCPPPPPNQCVTPDCNDGSTPVCLIAVMPECADDEVLAVRNGCFSCVDARTCEEPAPPPVQCVAGSECGEGFHCELPDGECGGVGSCVEDYQFCYEIYAPVCGCDGETYDNDCFARASGNSIAHEGACEPTPPPLGCQADSDCDDGEVCTQVQCITAPCPALCLPAPEPSCAGSCGGQSDDGCWCDDQCAQFGDCCSDVADVCQ
jgi:hypothetical protein